MTDKIIEKPSTTVKTEKSKTDVDIPQRMVTVKEKVRIHNDIVNSVITVTKKVPKKPTLFEHFARTFAEKRQTVEMSKYQDWDDD